jgi:hypothetical protein
VFLCVRVCVCVRARMCVQIRAVVEANNSLLEKMSKTAKRVDRKLTGYMSIHEFDRLLPALAFGLTPADFKAL